MRLVGAGHFVVEASATASPERVFEILADIPNWQRWAGPFVRHSYLDHPGQPERMGIGAVRKLGSAPIWSYEEITAFEPPTYLAYELRSGLPIRDYRADVRLSPLAAGGTALRWEGRFGHAPPGTARLFTAMLRFFIGMVARRLVATADRRDDLAAPRS